MVPFKSFDAVVYISSVSWLEIAYMFSFLSGLPLVLLSIAFLVAEKFGEINDNVLERETLGNKSHSFWSEGSAAEQL